MIRRSLFSEVDLTLSATMGTGATTGTGDTTEVMIDKIVVTDSDYPIRHD